MNVDTTKKFNHISLCTGYGGIDLGLARVIKGLRAIAYCEIELYAIENLIDKMEKGIIAPAPIWSNLKTFPFKDFCGSVDILSGGFPCQPFSSAGRRDGDTDPRHLFPYIKQGIIDSRPAFVLLENVRGLISSKLQSDGWNDPKETSVLLHVLREMERIGYECHWGIFSARETGLPHLRQRVFILGKRADIETSRLEEFSKYFHDSSQSQSCTFTRQRVCLCESNHEHDTGANGTCDTAILLQEITESTFSTEGIRSSSICTPSGRDREQQFYEPPRTLRKDMGNANQGKHKGCEYVHTIQGSSEHGGKRQHDCETSTLRINERASEDLGNSNKERFEGCEHDHTDQRTSRDRPREWENIDTSTLGHDERSSEKLANTSETGLHRCDENAGNGGLLEQQETGARLNCITSPTIGQIDIHRTTNDERTSTSEIGNREDTGRDQLIELPRDVEPTMGRNVDGFTDWVDYEGLCQSYTSIVDEIALLGNGVVPATAELAFRILFNKFL
jgi:DNA-cytosine methyltransferase